MARLYADEDFHYDVVKLLRKRGHDILTVAEAGQAGQGIGDPDVLAFATSLGRAVLTYNYWHFIRLHTRVRPHAGIIVCSRDDDLAALAARIDQAVAACLSLDNQLLRIKRPSTP